MQYAHLDHTRIAYPNVRSPSISGVLTWDLLKRLYREEDGAELQADRPAVIPDAGSFSRVGFIGSQAYVFVLHHEEGSDLSHLSFVFKVQDDRQRSLYLYVSSAEASKRTRRNAWSLIMFDQGKPFYTYYDSVRRLLYAGPKDRLSVFIVGSEAGEKEYAIHKAGTVGRGFNTNVVETLTRQRLCEAKVNATLLYMQPVVSDLSFRT